MRNLLQLYRKGRKNRNCSNGNSLFSEQITQLKNFSWSNPPKTGETFTLQSFVDIGVFRQNGKEQQYYITYEQTLDKNLRMIYCWFRVFIPHKCNLKQIGYLKGAFFDNAFREVKWPVCRQAGSKKDC